MELEFVRSASDRKYVLEDIEALPPIDKKVILDALEDLVNFPIENLIAAQIVKPLHLPGAKLFELVVKSLGVGYRIFFVRRDSSYWLLHLIKKKTSKTPPREIETALSRSKLINQNYESR